MNTLEQLRVGKLTGSRRLNLSCGLKEFPSEIFELADTLEILDLSGNALTSLPEDLPRLHKLKILFCSDNLFTCLPEVLGRCAQLSMVGFKANRISSVPASSLPQALRWLILTDNLIRELPAELGCCTQLQKLMLSGNHLQALPDAMASCEKLELLRISANQFTALPEWLFNLPRLTWLAYAGNPFCTDIETAALTNNPITGIAWNTLQIQHKLGEGASGVIHQALWSEGTDKQVAVKLFKGAVTSDGLPHSEMAACIGAGNHPNLIGVHGEIHSHPADTNGLVLSLVNTEFSNLAGPPSLDSCTRDIYSADTSFSLNMALSMALGIASAAQHLHAHGIMHGDLYAHNILHCEAGRVLLGDFGAASFFEVEDEQRAYSLQRIEVRAFACLLEELLEHCNGVTEIDSESSRGTRKVLMELQARCAHSNPAARPLFAEISQILHVLSSQIA